MNTSLSKPTAFRKSVISSALAVAALGLSTAASALGLGDITVKSAMGEPLNAEVEVLVASDAEKGSVVLTNASREDYIRQGIRFNESVSGLNVRLEARGKRLFAVLKTDAPLRESYASLVLDGVSNAGRVKRSYNVVLAAGALGEPMAYQAKPVAAKGAQPGYVGPISVKTFEATGEALTEKKPETVSIAVKDWPSETAIDPVAKPAEPAKTTQAAPVQTAANVPASSDSMPSKAVKADGDIRPVNTYDSIQEVGKRPGKIEIVKGYGHEQSLGKALSQIVPKGWRGYAGDAGVKMVNNVSWAGSSLSWLEVMDRLLERNGMTAVVSWDKKEVTFYSAPVSAQDVGAPVAQQTTAPAPVVAPAPAQPDLTKAELAQAHSKISELQAQVGKLSEEKAAAEKRAADADANIDSLRDNLDEANKMIESNDDNAAKIITRMRGELGSANNEVVVLKAQVQERDQTISDLNARLSAASGAAGEQVAGLTAAIQEKDKALSELNVSLQAKTQEAQNLSVALAEKDKALETIRAELAQAQADLSKLQKPVVAPAAVKQEVAPMASSWKPVSSPSFFDRNPQVFVNPDLPSLQVFGTLAGDQPAVRSAGVNTSMFNALQQVVPQGWTLYSKSAKVAKLENVSWSGAGREWTVVLNDLLVRHSLKADINATAKEVSISDK